jgi:hypothetical protein
MNKLLPVLVLFFLIISSGHSAIHGLTDEENGTSLLSSGNLRIGGFSLLDPSKLQRSTVLSYGVSTNGSGASYQQALVMNTFSYRISEPLSVRLHLGFSYYPSLPSFSNASRSSVLPGFEIDYKPFNNFFIHFEYNSPNFYNPYRSLNHDEYSSFFSSPFFPVEGKE